MTNAIFMNTLFPFSKSQNIDNEGKIFIEEARKSMETAETEISFGDATNNAIWESPQTNSNLASIAIWHYEKGLANYERAIRNFEQAKCLVREEKYKKYVDLRLKKCVEKSNFISLRKQQTEILFQAGRN